MTLGEYRVGISFNPGGNETVNKIKRAAADLIDLVDSVNERDVAVVPASHTHAIQAYPDPEVLRLKALAMTNIEDAAMWAVKAATKPAWE